MRRDRVRHLQALFLPAGALEGASWQPSADVYQTRDGGWLVKFDLAGIRPEDVKLTATGKRLTLQGIRRDTLREEGCRYYRMEISYSHFERSVDLPVEIDPARVRTNYRDGMLLVHIQGEGKK
ncbi:MAG TPA: Hsp20/alpha crystallin family protein [Gemmataceae bacterium]|nr:Hsp20/alpha crystallin family protein [Gemmataceae bacterium]